MSATENVTATLRAQEHGHQPVVCFEPGIARRDGSMNRFVDDKCVTLRANMGDNQPAVCFSVENHPMDSRVTIQDDGIVQTLSARMGTGGGNTPFILIQKCSCPQDTQSITLDFPR